MKTIDKIAVDKARAVALFNNIDEESESLVATAVIQGYQIKERPWEHDLPLDFGDALRALKLGLKVTRKGWNGRGMWLWLKPATNVKSEWCKDPMLKAIADSNGGEIEAFGTICMKTADNKILSGWLASQTDLLSEDWIIVK